MHASWLFTRGHWQNTDGSGLHEIVEGVGLILIVVAIAGRTWCSLYIGGRKKRFVVQDGPYSICRNPLYVFSFIGAAGVGAQFGTITIAVLICATVILVFTVVTRKEERFLQDKFGVVYEAYCARVPRFIPNFHLWLSAPTLEIQTSLVTRAFLDSCLFLTAKPAAELVELFQGKGYLPIYLLLP